MDNKYLIYNDIINSGCKSIINAGCGTGKDYIYFKDLFTKNNILWNGIEITDFMVEEGKRNNVPIKKGNILYINYIDNTFDCALSIDVFEHLIDIKTALYEMIRVSKKEVIIHFFKIPQPIGTKLILNKHIDNGEIKKEEIMTENILFLVENPGWRNGYTKGSFYNWHNKNYIELILNNNNNKVHNYIWKEIIDDKFCILLKINLNNNY